MSDLKITGKVISIRDTQQVTDTFSKRSVWLELAADDPKYNQVIDVQFVQDKTSLLDQFAKDDMVTIDFNLRGRGWTDPKTNEKKVFNTIQGWRISKADAPQAQPSANADGLDLPF